ncbi:MAG: serine/threonine protein kinase, partial [Candidatus Binatia bacterium]
RNRLSEFQLREGHPQLSALSTQEIRQRLNRRSADILSSGGEASRETYALMWRDYDEAIHRAWYIGVSPPSNKLMQYTIIREIAAGAFGRVYEARDPDGGEVAIKVLRSEVRSTPGMLDSFRRGVRSMRILSSRGVQGMIAYKDAVEIPAFVVMKLVHGPDLRNAVEQRALDDWPSILRVSVELARIIRAAHTLPERVLHRDIRPSNIMLDGYYDDPNSWAVAVLDFDLSWHREAYEKTVVEGQHVSGYLAPEQYLRNTGMSTRSALVDSYGLGMTLYFLSTANEPVLAEHKHAHWSEKLRESVMARVSGAWRSVPRRFARIIENATRDAQPDRWDVAVIAGELERLTDALLAPEKVNAAELIAEELLARTNYSELYTWDQDKLHGEVDLPTGVTLTVRGNEKEGAVVALICWQERRREEQRRVEKWMAGAIEKADSILRRASWTTDVQRGSGSHEFRIWASARSDNIRANFDRFADCLNRAMAAVEF